MNERKQVPGESVMVGTIIKGIGSFYSIEGEDGNTYLLRARGKLRHEHLSPLIGDRVRFTPGREGGEGSLEEILPRENELVRPAVANIRHLLIVVSPCPEPDLLLVDTLLAMAFKQHISPSLLVNKCDLDAELYHSILAQYAGLGIPVLRLSAMDGTGLGELRQLLSQGIACFAGQSGVGKSSLTALATGIQTETGEISRKIHRGRHTTRHAELLRQDGYQILDTPGFSLLELWDGLEPAQLQSYYPELEPYQGQCRFSPCYHSCEPGCAVLEAVKKGELNGQRMERYRVLLEKTRERWNARYR